MSIGTALVYCNFMGKFRDSLNTTVSALAQEKAGLQFEANDKFIILECCLNDEEGEDVDVPYVRFQFRE